MFEKQNSAKDQMCGARAVMNLPGEACDELGQRAETGHQGEKVNTFFFMSFKALHLAPQDDLIFFFYHITQRRHSLRLIHIQSYFIKTARAQQISVKVEKKST